MAKRARTLTGDHLRSSSSSNQAPSWGAKRARSGSALRDRSLPDSEWRDWSSIGNGPAWLISERVLAGDDVADYADLPELRGHRVFGPTAEGLLVLLDEATFAVRLLNPLTRQLTDLPPANTVLDPTSLMISPVHYLLHVLTVHGAGLADGSATVVVYFENARKLAAAKPGDERWTVVEPDASFASVSSFAGRFYCATRHAIRPVIVEVRTTDHRLPPQLVVVAKLAGVPSSPRNL
uniref:KIB1-4 beta-propeller domain-containing protein n=1 Tax=Oryza glaberrima TaxID=4538 RepID=I1QEN8_ORYGL